MKSSLYVKKTEPFVELTKSLISNNCMVSLNVKSLFRVLKNEYQWFETDWNQTPSLENILASIGLYLMEMLEFYIQM